MTPTTEGEIYDEPVRVEASEPGPLAAQLERAMERTDRARVALEQARATYNRAHTREVELEIKMRDRREARQKLDAEARRL